MDAEVHEERLLVEAAENARRARLHRQLRVGALQGAILAALVFGWQYGSGRWIDALFLSDPASIARAFVRITLKGTLWWHLQVTLVEMTLGYVVGVAAGVTAALSISALPFGKPITRPILLMAFATPKVALAPLIIIWFGIGLAPKVMLAAALVFFVVYFSTLAGVASVDANMVTVLRLMGASRAAVFRKAVLPSATPHIVTAMRITLPAALIGAIIGEFVSSSRGIGYLIAAASSRYDTAEVFAGIGSLLIFVLLLNAGVTALERSLLRWRPVARQGL